MSADLNNWPTADDVRDRVVELLGEDQMSRMSDDHVGAVGLTVGLERQHCVDVLNRVHQADPSILPALISHRVPCNDAVANDPTVQVGPDLASGRPETVVGLLGIINGIFGCRGIGGGWIAAIWSDDHSTLERFEVLA